MHGLILSLLFLLSSNLYPFSFSSCSKEELVNFDKFWASIESDIQKTADDPNSSACVSLANSDTLMMIRQIKNLPEERANYCEEVVTFCKDPKAGEDKQLFKNLYYDCDRVFVEVFIDRKSCATYFDY